MDTEEYKNIESIQFPNTATDEATAFYTSKSGFTFEQIYENGEMAAIEWIGVFKDGKKIAQIKQSVCNIFFKK